MIQRMKHSEHGFTHAYSDQEIEALEVCGWEKEDVETPQVKLKGKPGRKPKNPSVEEDNNGNSPAGNKSQL